MSMPNHHETLGDRLLAELARRQATGTLFTYSQRQQLRQIDDRRELRDCLTKWHLGQIDTSGSEQQIVDALCQASAQGPMAKAVLCGLDILSIAAEFLQLL